LQYKTHKNAKFTVTGIIDEEVATKTVQKIFDEWKRENTWRCHYVVAMMTAG
jgi:hypothetical protein